MVDVFSRDVVVVVVILGLVVVVVMKDSVDVSSSEIVVA